MRCIAPRQILIPLDKFASAGRVHVLERYRGIFEDLECGCIHHPSTKRFRATYVEECDHTAAQIVDLGLGQQMCIRYIVRIVRDLQSMHVMQRRAQKLRKFRFKFKGGTIADLVGLPCIRP